MVIALAGNQNCGKTTLFNLLTGASQRVGNWPGVTVERKAGRIRKHPAISLVDLPGIYSLSPYSIEERTARDYLTGKEPDGILNIVDATNLERNLYLTLQLCELEKPMVIALNMMDEALAGGDEFRIEALSRELGIPVVPIAARTGEGIDTLLRTVMSTIGKPPYIQNICQGHLSVSLDTIARLVGEKADKAGLPRRYAAAKLIEGDAPILKRLKLNRCETEAAEEICRRMERRLAQERDTALAAARYDYIRRVVGMTRTQKNCRGSFSRKIDRILTGKWTAMPCFVLILSLVFWLTFGPLGMVLSDAAADFLNGIRTLTAARIDAMGLDRWLQGLIADGILTGIFSMLGFLPVILLLFFFLSLLEDSGYMARAAFITDRLLGRFGLSGRAFFPLIMGFGCSVPAIMAARGTTCAEERRLTVLVTPFISCTARIPIYGVFCAAFFPGKGFIIMTLLYLLGVAAALLSAFFLKDVSAFKASDVPFVMELPPYRLPSVRSVVRLLWNKGAEFVRRAFTVILTAAVLIWFLQFFTPGLQEAEHSSDSLLAAVGGFIAPVFAPLGFGTWQASTALLAGFAAKEAVVSTIAVLYSTGVEGLPEALSAAAGFTPASALSFMVFCLLYMPCAAAFAAIKRELGGLGKAATAALFQTGTAWLVSYLVYHLARLAGI